MHKMHHESRSISYQLVVEPTHLKNMLVKLDHFPKDRGETDPKNWNRHLAYCLREKFQVPCYFTTLKLVNQDPIVLEY